MTLATFEERLRDPDLDVRAYLVGKLMRQAKPDDVFGFVSMDQIALLCPRLERYLGKSRPFWTFLLGYWQAHRGGLVADPVTLAEHPVETELEAHAFWSTRHTRSAGTSSAPC